MASKSSPSRPRAGTSRLSPEGLSDGVGGVADAGAFFAPPELAPPPHAGHRERLRARFLKGGAEAMPDYELLELALFAVRAEQAG